MHICTPSNLKYSEESFTKRVDDAASSYSRRSVLTPTAVTPDKSVARWLYGKGQSLRFGAQTKSCRPIKKTKKTNKKRKHARLNVLFAVRHLVPLVVQTQLSAGGSPWIRQQPESTTSLP